MCWFLKIKRERARAKKAHIYKLTRKQHKNECMEWMRSRAKIACILYHDRDLNEMCDRVGQQRHRHSLACDCLHQLIDATKHTRRYMWAWTMRRLCIQCGVICAYIVCYGVLAHTGLHIHGATVAAARTIAYLYSIYLQTNRSHTLCQWCHR